MRWPDKKLASSLLHGFRIVGKIEESHVFKTRETPDVHDPQSLLAEHDSNLRAWFSKGTCKEQQFLKEACEADYKKGFGSELLPKAQVDRRLGFKNWSSKF